MSPEVSLHITQTDVSSAWTDTYGTYLGKGRDREGERQRPYSDWNTNTPPGTPSPSETRTEQRQFRNPDRKSHPRCKPKSQPSPGTRKSRKGAAPPKEPAATHLSFPSRILHPACRGGTAACAAVPLLTAAAFQRPPACAVPSAWKCRREHPQPAGDLPPIAGAEAHSCVNMSTFVSSPQGTLFVAKRSVPWNRSHRNNQVQRAGCQRSGIAGLCR